MPILSDSAVLKDSYGPRNAKTSVVPNVEWADFFDTKTTKSIKTIQKNVVNFHC